MKRLKGDPRIIDEVTVGIHDDECRDLVLRQARKHEIAFELGAETFRFETVRTRPDGRPHGPGIELVSRVW